jgi:sensor histidine kinase regulating citrate/malate metabolism
MSNKKKMRLRSKINLLVLLNIVFVLLLVMSALSYIIVDRKFKETGDRALFIARTVAGLPQVVHGFNDPDPSSVIQPLVESLRKQANAEFIVVANMDLIRYNHPNPNNIGQHLSWEDYKIDQKVLQGQDVIATSAGTLGYSLRGKTPVYDTNHKQIGLVSVGFLVHDIWKELLSLFIRSSLIGLIALLFGFVGAHLLSGHIKKQIFNMEPDEIAFLTQEQAAILNSTREGIIAINSDGKITTCNREAKKILEIMEEEDVIGANVNSILPSSRLCDVVRDGTIYNDKPMIIGNTLSITNRVPVYSNNKVVGAVATFRDKLQLDQIDQRLADIGQYADSLRSQRHEFMNKLHLISGLIKMKEYELVNELIEEINEEQQNLLDSFLTKIRDPAIVGLLIGKINRAKELGLHVVVDTKSLLSNPCPHRDIVVTILGNAIENSLEAMSGNKSASLSGTIMVSLLNTTDYLNIVIQDSGPGVDPQLEEDIFNDGVTTKGSGRGFGLALLSRLVANIGGKLSMDSSSSGATLEVSLPK